MSPTDDVDLANHRSRRFEFRARRECRRASACMAASAFEGDRRLVATAPLQPRRRSGSLTARHSVSSSSAIGSQRVRARLRQGSRTVEPTVRLASRSRCACATSRSA